MLPIYQYKQTLDKPNTIFNDNSNAGLWFERFYDYQIFDNNGNIITDDTVKKNAKTQEKECFFRTFNGSKGVRECGNAQALKSHAERQANLCHAQQGISTIYKNDWLMAIGLGNSHPLENGLLWHPTLGIPYFQGSTVKGLAKALMEKWGADPKLIKRWFGSVNTAEPKKQAVFNELFGIPLTEELQKQLDEQSIGAFIFLDAIPIQPVMLKQAIMTPHYGDWYQKGDTSPMDKKVQPGDWHSPVPVSFLAVEKAVMQFSVIPRLGAKVENDELEQVSNVICLALEHLGVGAKTATGFGRMKKDVQAEKEQKTEQQAKLKAIEDAKLAEEAEKIRQAAIKNLTVNQILIYDFAQALLALPNADWHNKANAQPKIKVGSQAYDFLDLFRLIETWSDDEQKFALEKVFMPYLPKLLNESISKNKKWKERINSLKTKLGMN